MRSKEYKQFCTTLNYIGHFLILGSTSTGCVSISALAYLVSVPIRSTSSRIGSRICAIKKYKSKIKKNKKKHEKMVLLARSKLISIEVLICKALINLVISNNEFLLKKR